MEEKLRMIEELLMKGKMKRKEMKKKKERNFR